MSLTPINVFSCFDGIACARLALERAKIPISKYYASEIDKNAIKVALHNYPDIVELGDINLVDVSALPTIDLMIGGSPCTSLSCARRQKASGLAEGESTLFWKFYELINQIKPRYFLMENVASMKASDRDTISNKLGVDPILINSSRVSAQLRARYYWTNIPNVTQPEDKKIKLQDILQAGFTEREKSYCLTATYSRVCARDYLWYGNRQMIFTLPIMKKINEQGDCLYRLADHVKWHHIIDPRSDKYRADNVLVTNYLGDFMRKLFPAECEMLQTMPINYTRVDKLSDAQRTKLIGNSFTVDVIVHILKQLKSELERQ